MRNANQVGDTVRQESEPAPLSAPDAPSIAAEPGDVRISTEFREALQNTLRTKKKAKPAAKREKFDIQLDRHEAKYVIPPRMVAEIRDFIRPFCERDPYGIGNPPEYVITTLQLDNEEYSLHRAREREVTARFKLRSRIYGTPGDSPVFLEIKKKIRGSIIKTRAKVPFEAWGEELIRSVKLTLPFKSRKEEAAFLEFVRLTREIGAAPKVLIRYIRESYFGTNDSYARVTFDRQLQYQPTDSWTSWGRGGTWMPIDTPLTQNKSQTFSGVVLELKTLSDAPQWMIDLVRYFHLERTGHCKYSNAIWQEGLFSGEPEPPIYEDSLLQW
jgi:hypothetical protein